MNENFYYGRVISITIFFISGLLTFISAFFFHQVTIGFIITYGISWILLTVLFSVLSRKKVIDEQFFPYLISTVSIFTNIATTYVYSNFDINLLIFSLILLSCMFFLNKRLVKHIICTEGVVIIFLYFNPFFEIDGIDLRKIWIVCGVLLTCAWIEFNFINFIKAQKRNSMEAAKSMDDMLRVVEMKCDDARTATKSKTSFLSNISHEIRTPISSIMGYNELIIRDTNEKDIREYALGIESTSNVLLSLINDIIDFSKIENGQMKMLPVKFNLSSFINDMLDQNIPVANEKNLQFVIDVNKNMPEYIYGDDARIKQVISNLVSNAIKYTDEGTVTVNFDYEQMSGRNIKMKVVVSDTGRGIKSEQLAKLYDSFDRLGVDSEGIKGNGIGLAITKRIIDMMNGSIEVESYYGHGSIFTITIPVVSLLDEKIGDYKERISKNNSNDKSRERLVSPTSRILFVDDNTMNLRIMTLLLKGSQIIIDTAVSGMEAIKLAKENAYDIIFLDHMMPLMDGVETLEKMKAEKLISSTPVIALTANVISGAREMYLDYGFSDYLSKPVDAKQLESTIIKWLPKSKLTTQK